MADKDHISVKALGLNTQPNEMGTPEGSLTVAENVEITRDNVIQVSPGFENFSTNLPPLQPQQLLSFAGTTYAFIDNGWWYKDDTSGNWYRKRGSLGAALVGPANGTILNGVLYITSYAGVIFALDLQTGIRTVIAGRFNVTAATTDGTGDAARFRQPNSITNDGTNLYVTDSTSQVVRRIAPPLTAGAAVVTTIAGTIDTSGTADGTGTVARFNTPNGIVFVGSSLYVCDAGNNSIRRIAAPLTLNAGVVTTVAGLTGTSGSADGTGTVARFNAPSGIASDGTNLFVTDGTNQVVKRIAPPLTSGAGVVTTIAGTAGSAGTANGTGTVARFTALSGLAHDGTNLFVADNVGIRKLAPPLTLNAAVVTTVAGTLGSSGSVDGIGSVARFQSIIGLIVNGTTELYMCDFGNGTMRKLYIGTTYVYTIDGVNGLSAPTVGIPIINGFMQGPS